MFAGSPDRLPAQGPSPSPPPPRAQYVFHVYVDPIFGDNARAFTLNPGATGMPPPLSRHRSNDTSGGGMNNGIGGVLQHAPYSFRTLTGPQGVGAYLDVVSAQYGSSVGGQHHPPWTISVGGEPKSAEWIVIHCAPGMYAPVLGGSPIDARNGLVFNGETWPFRLRHRASLQGTSALDTIFDARRSATAVLVLDRPGWPDTHPSHDGSFIDGITIRGARSDGEAMSSSNGTGAGILIDRGGNSQVCISNCFIVDNTVGIAVDTSQSAQIAHEPRIVNNTFARNVIALWNGNRQTGEMNVGRGKLTLLNNAFDTWLPGVAAPPASRAFAGVSAEDLLVTAVLTNVATVSLTPPLSFNAWEATRPFVPVAPSNWQIPMPRTLTAMPVPRVDITNYTGTVTGTTRGILYLNDTLRAAGVAGVGVDHSPHDFRLAPQAAEAGAPPTSAPKLNPLVNQGLTLTDPATSPPLVVQQITMANGLWLTWGGRQPGLTPPGVAGAAEDLARLDVWDLDAEGFGNPRVHARTGYLVPVLPNNPNPDPIPLTIDLGADEMGELIIGGYIDGTRILTHSVPNAPGVTDHTRLFFFDLYAPGNSYPRPVANRIVGRTVTWYAHVQQTVGPDNYTAGSGKRKQIVDGADPTFAARPRFMRSLECDFSPPLFPDPHPQWGTAWESFGLGPDPHGSMPWYTGQGPAADNAYVYYNPPPVIHRT